MTSGLARGLLLAGVFLPLALLAIAVFLMVAMPGRSFSGAPIALDDEGRATSERLRGHLLALGRDIGERNLNRPERLEAAAAFLERTLADIGYEVTAERFEVLGQPVRNVVAVRTGGSRPGEIVVVGSHYDTAPGSPGANDNGSGVAAALEVARAFHGRTPARTVRFVFFVNEEPPYFQTEAMGSVVHATRARARGYDIRAMVSLETLGYYSSQEGSQQYPFPFGWLYPSTGNFVAFVGKVRSRGLVRRCVRVFRESATVPSEGLAAPNAVPGVGWSDHWAFWQAGYPALMITDTAPYRDPAYHTESDQPERLDPVALARVVLGLVRVVNDLATTE